MDHFRIFPNYIVKIARPKSSLSRDHPYSVPVSMTRHLNLTKKMTLV